MLRLLSVVVDSREQSKACQSSCGCKHKPQIAYIVPKGLMWATIGIDKAVKHKVGCIWEDIVVVMLDPGSQDCLYCELGDAKSVKKHTLTRSRFSRMHRATPYLIAFSQPYSLACMSGEAGILRDQANSERGTGQPEGL